MARPSEWLHLIQNFTSFLDYCTGWHWRKSGIGLYSFGLALLRKSIGWLAVCLFQPTHTRDPYCFLLIPSQSSYYYQSVRWLPTYHRNIPLYLLICLIDNWALESLHHG